MKRLAKWVTLLWSLFCLAGIIYGLGRAGEKMAALGTEAEKVGGAIGLGFGMFLWFFIWIAVAGPAIIIYLVTGRRPISSLPDPGPTKTCPNCAETLKAAARQCRFCGQRFDS